jgi:MFS family permease
LPRRGLPLIYMTAFVDMAGIGLIIPFLAYHAEHLGGTGLWVGLIYAGYSAAQFVGSAMWGRLSDRFGRRPILLICLAGTSLAFLANAMAPTLAWLLALRVLAGLFAGSIATAQAYVADVTAPEQRAKYLGWLGASMGMGFVIGPAFGAALAPFGFAGVCYAAAGTLAVMFVVALFALPETRRPGAEPTTAGPLELTALHRQVKSRAVLQLMIASFLMVASFVSLTSLFPLTAKAAFGMGERELGIILTLVGVTIVIVQGGLVGRLARRFGEKHVALAGSVMIGGMLIVMTTMPGRTATYGLMCLAAAGSALINPNIMAMVSRLTTADRQGGALGGVTAINSLARALIPIGAGFAFDLGPSFPYWMGVFLMAPAIIALARVKAPAAEI